MNARDGSSTAEQGSPPIWGDWVLGNRDGGSDGRRTRLFRRLAPVRDQILDGAGLSDGDAVVDVGCGDGFLGLAALERVRPSGRVTFVDISPRVLERCREQVAARGALAGASFVQASADDLGQLEDASADAVTTRAVLVYLFDKSVALREFERVLRPGGRISIWEPVNAYGEPEERGFLLGYDISGSGELGDRVKAVFDSIQPPEDDPMLAFGERELLGWAGAAGFSEMWMRLEVRDRSPEAVEDWEAFLDSSPNPLAPTWRQAIDRALSTGEARTFLGHLREVALEGRGRYRAAGVHLVARKG